MNRPLASLSKYSFSLVRQSLSALLVLALFAPGFLLAQTRSYHYASIDTTVVVNKDTTINIEEAQTYLFEGEYHQAERVIPHKGLDAIDNIVVIDLETRANLERSSHALDKTQPSSWGKYYAYEDGGQTHIVWYYNNTASPASHSWLVKYTVHGALAFYKDHDELYWNVFTNYDVPVDSVSVTVRLPGEITLPSASFYTNSNLAVVAERPDTSSYHFSLSNIPPEEDVTFAVGWQKGLVDQSAYWGDFLRIYWGLIAGLLIILATIIFFIYYWRRIETVYKGRGTVIAEYEPPRGLSPAMTEIVAKGRTSEKTLPATVVDLAVRGYLTIEEENHKVLFFDNKNYVLTKTQKDISGLRPYESEFYTALFARGEKFSLAEVKNSMTRQNDMYKATASLNKHILEELQTEQQIYLNPPTQERTWRTLFHAGWVFILCGIFIFSDFVEGPGISKEVFVGSILISALAILYWIRIRPWLNTDGHRLKEDILGFKLFLEVTGKDRMQNLTPDMFEKYLPYAMVFGVEKEWAAKFESLNLPQPQWYHSNAAFVGGSGSSFSPTGFASGFSASFASTFASSGSGGASGGGGGAGGGGGGGGGGAS